MTEQSYTLSLSFEELRWIRAALLLAEDSLSKNNGDAESLNAIRDLLKKVIEVEE